MSEELRYLNNIFINTSGNKITPVRILFNSKIIDIQRVSEKEFDWKDINTIEKKESVTTCLGNISHAENIKNIDGGFNLLMPGAVDPHVHFDTPGFEFRDTFDCGSTAAASGGVTTVIDMPCTSLPPVTSLSNFLQKLNTVKSRSLVDFAFWGGVRGNDFENPELIERNVQELDEAGAASYKVYVISGMDTFQDLSYEQIKEAAKYISKTGKPVGVHAEDKVLIESRRKFFREQNLNTWEYYCRARDSKAEKTAVEKMINISNDTGVRVHIVHLSSKDGLGLIRKARNDGTEISTETCPHYLHFTQDDFKDDSIRNILKTAPPVKEVKDKEALWQGLEDGSISFVTTDHAGCDPLEEKSSYNFWEVYGGIPGIEHRVPYIISEGFMNGKLSLEKSISLLSEKSAEYFIQT